MCQCQPAFFFTLAHLDNYLHQLPVWREVCTKVHRSWVSLMIASKCQMKGHCDKTQRQYKKLKRGNKSGVSRATSDDGDTCCSRQTAMKQSSDICSLAASGQHQTLQQAITLEFNLSSERDHDHLALGRGARTKWRQEQVRPSTD